MKEGINIPQDTKMERSVLGALIIDDKAHLEALPILKEVDMFYSPKHQYIFTAIRDLSFRNDPIDLMTVNSRLMEMEKLEEAGGTMYLVELSNAVSSSAHIENWCRILLQHWIKRRLIADANKVIAEAFKPDTDSLDILEMAAKLNDNLNDILFSGTKTVSYPDALTAVEKRVELLSNQKEGEFTGVETGFQKLNQFTGGWQPSDLVIIAARPGMGKTSLVLKTLVECGKKGIPVGFFSLEMSTQQLAARTVAIESNFHLSQLIRDGFEKNEYFKTLTAHTSKMKQYPVYIEDSGNVDIRDIIARARIWKRKHDIQILFVDYIQLATDKTKGNNREQEIASISRSLKMLAKELNLPVIALSQLSRKVEERVDKHPKLSDLRESGAIEQDADIVCFLYRHEYYYPDGDLPDELVKMGANAEFSFAKYRSGSLETKGLYFDKNKVKYTDRAPHYNEEDDVPFEVPQGDPDIAF